MKIVVAGATGVPGAREVGPTFAQWLAALR